jgi:hypothetical protein
MNQEITLAPEDLESLRCAHEHLEHPSLAARLTNFVGLPIERGLKLLPKTWYDGLRSGTRKALESSLGWAVTSLESTPQAKSQDGYHKMLSATSGALGGFFGLAAVLAELPVSTTITLRSIADIARSEGEDIHDIKTRLACVEVLALGGTTDEDDAAETGYYGIRLALALHLSRIPDKVLENSILKPSHPALVELIAAIAARFGVVVTEKAAAQMVPILGALSGALINVIFMQHFQDVAKAHFRVRALERKYGEALIRSEYDRLSQANWRGAPCPSE